MKKLFTLLTLGALCSSSFAAQYDLSKATLDPEVAARFNLMNAQIKAGDVTALNQGKKIMQKSYTDAKYQWDIAILLQEEVWTDALTWTDKEGNEVKREFADFPYYWVNYQLTATDLKTGDMVTGLNIPLLWPSYYWWEQYNIELKTGEEMPLAERNLTIVSPQDLALASAETHGKGFAYDGSANAWFGDESKSFLGLFPVAAQSWFPGGSFGDYNGQEAKLVDGNTNQITIFNFDSMDQDEETFQITNQLYFTNGAVANVAYDGEIRARGFVKKTYQINPNNVHVFYCGEESAEELGWENLFQDTTWGPVSKFFVLYASEDYISGVREESTVFDYPGTPWKMCYLAAADEDADSSDLPLAYVGGFVYGAKDQKTPYGYYDLLEPKITYKDNGRIDKIIIAPAPNTMVPWGYNSQYMPWSTGDEACSFQLIMDGYYQALRPYTRFCIGDKTNGMFLSGIDGYGDKYLTSYKGDITFHPDPNDVQKYETIKAVGDVDAVEGVAAAKDFTVTAENGVIAVAVENDARVAVYTMAGAVVKTADLKAGETLNVAAENGIYVVKAGNGVKKVVL